MMSLICFNPETNCFISVLSCIAHGLEEITSPKVSRSSSRGSSGGLSSKEASLRAFLENEWVSGFHDVEILGNIVRKDNGILLEQFPSITVLTR